MGKTIWFIGLFPLKPVKKQYQLGSRVAFLEICVNGFALKICSVLYDSRRTMLFDSTCLQTIIRWNIASFQS